MFIHLTKEKCKRKHTPQQKRRTKQTPTEHEYFSLFFCVNSARVNEMEGGGESHADSSPPLLPLSFSSCLPTPPSSSRPSPVSYHVSCPRCFLHTFCLPLLSFPPHLPPTHLSTPPSCWCRIFHASHSILIRDRDVGPPLVPSKPFAKLGRSFLLFTPPPSSFVLSFFGAAFRSFSFVLPKEKKNKKKRSNLCFLLIVLLSLDILCCDSPLRSRTQSAGWERERERGGGGGGGRGF